MTKQFLKTAVLSAALLLGTVGISAYSAGVTVGGGNGNVVSGSGGANGSGASGAVGTTNGPLATFDNSGDAAAGGSQSDGTVNLGGLFDGIDVSGGGIGGDTQGAGDGGGMQSIVASLSSSDRQLLKLRCRDVLRSPADYESDVIALCKLIAKM